MADRFPSLDDFSEGQTEARGTNNLGADDSDPGDDFLARERAALGDDANQFHTRGDHAGALSMLDDDDDLLGGGDYSGQVSSGQDVNQFESSFPAIDTRNENVGPGGSITGTTIPGQSSYTNYDPHEEELEPEVIQQWRERRDHSMQQRASSSASKKAETVKAAQTAIDDFYENYNTKKDKTIAQSRKEAEEFLANREDTSAGGTSWERIAKLVDLSGKGSKGGANGTGKERFRELLTSLRKDEHAPGAGGV